jgi:hypothetical protein
VSHVITESLSIPLIAGTRRMASSVAPSDTLRACNCAETKTELGNHGGPTQTYALLPGSKAKDAGVNAPLTTLAAGVGAGDTSFDVSDVTSFAPGRVLRLNQELVSVVVNANTNTLTVQRGVDGTARSAHASGTSLFIGTDQRGVLRAVNPHGTAVVDMGAFD